MRSPHSTETALYRIVNDLNSESGDVSLLVDFSLALENIDHNILIERLEKRVGLSGPVLDWPAFYLKAQLFSESMYGESHRGQYLVHCSSVCTCCPLATQARKTRYVSIIMPVTHSYTCPFSPVESLVECIKGMNTWVSRNVLQLNCDKTEILIIGAKPLQKSVPFYPLSA